MVEMTLAGFMEHLVHVAFEMHHHEHRALERAAKIVEKEAKAEIGHYQSDAGQFAGWAELADTTKEERVKQGFSENDPGLRTGDMRDSIGHVVDGNEAAIGSNDEHLVWFELGTERQPPRSVLAMAAVHKEKEVVEVIGHGVATALVGRDVFNHHLPIE